MAHVRRDSRSHRRLTLSIPVQVSDPAGQVASAIAFEAAEVSGGGAFLPSELLLEVGERLRLTFALPDGRQVQAQARVVRASRGTPDEPSGIGVEFVDISPDDRAAIERLLP
ncbi:MAG TPA: PilZ domain-containing protein [Polyangia bacterium]|nr:PilZ domain-containing protein [Polyangia bacterium]